MQYEAIAKGSVGRHALTDYEREYRNFSWDAARKQIADLDGAINIGYEAVDRHVAEGHGGKTAIRWIGRTGAPADISYAALKASTDQFARLLQELGLQRGERIYSLLGRVPDLYVAALGAMKSGCVFCPLFSAFGPEPIKSRMQIGDARVLVTTAVLYRKKVAPIRAELPNLRYVLITGGVGDPTIEDVTDLQSALAAMPADFAVVRTRPEDPAILHFTSGTTGKPKGAVHVHEAVVAHRATAEYALDLKPDDIFWCTADPGWVTGTSYGIIAPLSIGCTLIMDEAEFDAERWYGILQEQKVTVWYTAPTAIRMLMKLGTDPLQAHDLSSVRFMASVGEPLNPEAVTWSNKAFGKPFHDNWWQTETGGIMIANFAAMDVKPGSMGRPLPGIAAGIVRRNSSDGVDEVTEPMAVGELALRPGWPSMFRGYLNESERYAKCFLGGWYLTGDLAMRDADGYYWFVGRADDVIKSSGHLIGPFEVESILMEHPAIAEAGVIGVPDQVAGELVKAFVSLKSGVTADEALNRDLLAHCRRRLGPAIAPRSIEFRSGLPRTRSGKIMRRLLKARELGLPEGDLSTLESDER